MRRLIAVGLLALFALGCKGMIPARPARTFYNSIVPEYLEYMEASDMDEDRKRIRRQAIQSFDRVLTEAEG